MEKPLLTSVQGAYEPPYAEIIEFAVEGGFTLTGVNAPGYDGDEGTELPGRTEIPNWHS